MASRLPIIKVKLDAFKGTVPTGIKDRLSIQQVRDFNKILADIRAAFPDQVSDLPQDFKTDSTFNMAGLTDIFPANLEYAVKMTLGVIRVIESEEG